jgi:hypothetical protein
VSHGETIVWGGDEFDVEAEAGYWDTTVNPIVWVPPVVAVPNPDYQTPAGNYNQAVANNGEMSVSFTPKLNFAWSAAGYDVKIVFPLTTPNDVEVDISKPGGWSLHLERPGLSGNSIVFTIPFNAFKVALGADLDGGDPDLDLDVDATFGNVDVGFGVHWDDINFAVNRPTFDMDIGIDIGGWGLTVAGATTGFGAGAWDPTLDVTVTGDVGPASLSLFFGLEDDGGIESIAFAGEVGVDLAGNTITAGMLRSNGPQHDWDGFTDDYGVFPYPGDVLVWAFWGGVEREWSSEHSSELTIFFSESPDITDSQNLAIEFTHTWTPVGGNVEVEGNIWYGNDFGGAADPVWGMGLTATIPLFPG